MSNPTFFSFDAPVSVVPQAKGAEFSPLFLAAIRFFRDACGFEGWYLSEEMKKAPAVPAIRKSNGFIEVVVFATYGDAVLYSEGVKKELSKANIQVHIFYLKSYETLRDVRTRPSVDDPALNTWHIDQTGLPVYAIGSQHAIYFPVTKSEFTYLF